MECDGMDRVFERVPVVVVVFGGRCIALGFRGRARLFLLSWSANDNVRCFRW
jgi:hypothetical protein